MKHLLFLSGVLLAASPFLCAATDLPATHTNKVTLTNTTANPSPASTNAPKAPKPIITPVPKTLPVITRGPYLQCGTTNSMVVRWRTDLPAPSLVRYGLSPTNLNKKTNTTGTLTEHVVLLSGLQPDTKYYYRIGVVDCPILATLTNNTLLMTVTNGSLAVSTPAGLQFANVTNETLVLSAEKNKLLITNPRNGRVVNSSNSFLMVSTTNNSMLVKWTNHTMAVSTTNHTRVIRPSTTPFLRPSFGTFAVLNTNVTAAGGDTNTFFFTSPLIGSRRPVRIWVLGDPGTRKPEQKQVRDAFFKFAGGRGPDLWLMLGDNAYQAGTDAEYQGSVFQAYPDLLKRCVLWPTLGNHDAGSADSATQSGIYYDIFTLPTQGQAGGVMSGTEAYYSFNYANVHIICLDSASSDRTTNGLMCDWLKRDLAANRQDWCIAYWHHPPYTKGSHDSDNEKEAEGIMRDLRTVFVPVLEAGGVDLVLSGHSHAYERSYLLDGHYGRSYTLEDDQNVLANEDGRSDGWGVYHKPSPGPAPHEGTVYMVAGSSGQTSGGRLLHPAMFTGLNILGSVVLDFDGLRLDSRLIDTSSTVRDYFTILKGPQPPEPSPDPKVEKPVLVADSKIPQRLRGLLRGDGTAGSRAAAVLATPSDQDSLLEVYQQSSDLSEKTALTWALACVGNAQVVTNFMRLLTNQFKRKEISPKQEAINLETIQAIGLLAARYEAPFELLKKAVNPAYWQTNEFWFSAEGKTTASRAASSSIRALGLSGRAEAMEVLTGLRKKAIEFKTKERPTDTPKVPEDVADAISDCDLSQKLGARAFQKRILER